MEQVPLGASGLMVSRLGYGCMGLSDEPRDDERAAALLRHAFELGVTFFDSANNYGKGHNERLIGRVFSGRTDEIVLATKCGPLGGPAAARRVDGRPERVRAACNASLRRFGVEIIDLYYLHGVDSAVPIEETVGAMSEMVTAGKVRALGLSEAAPAAIRRAHALHPIAAVQGELSLWSRQAEGGPLHVCRELGITFVACRPLGLSFLTRNVHSAKDPGTNSRWARSEPRTSSKIARNAALLNRLRELAAELRCTPRQLALAWVLGRGHDVVPIPGTRDINQLEENVAAVHATPGPEHIRTLNTIFSSTRPLTAVTPPIARRL